MKTLPDVALKVDEIPRAQSCDTQSVEDPHGKSTKLHAASNDARKDIQISID